MRSLVASTVAKSVILLNCSTPVPTKSSKYMSNVKLAVNYSSAIRLPFKSRFTKVLTGHLNCRS